MTSTKWHCRLCSLGIEELGAGKFHCRHCNTNVGWEGVRVYCEDD